MKTLLSTAVVLVLALSAQAQSYNSPESVEYDPANGRYLVSNPASGQILAREDGTGTLTTFVTGIPTGPHGLEIMGTSVYACTGGKVMGYDLSSGATTLDLNLSGAFLNGITNDGTYLFVTDFSAKKIYRINPATQSFNEMVNLNGVSGTPNGIVYDAADDRLVFVEWGNNASINAVSMSDSSVTELIATSLGNLDGIVLDAAGNFYVSSWSPNAIQFFNHTFTVGPNALVTTGLGNPADLHYNQANDTLAAPNSANNTVTFHYMGTITGVADGLTSEVAFTVYPNPAKDRVSITIAQSREQILDYEVFDLSGQRQKAKGTYKSGEGTVDLSLDLRKLSAGNYVVKLNTLSGPLSIPFIKKGR